MVRISLAAARVNAGYSQKDAAAALKVSNTTLGNWENGRSYPNQQYIERLCELYGIHYDSIRFGKAE